MFIFQLWATVLVADYGKSRDKLLTTPLENIRKSNLLSRDFTVIIRDKMMGTHALSTSVELIRRKRLNI